MSQRFWDAATPLISVTERHPFLVAMVDGSLPVDNFRYYVIQDALYLTDFAECFRRLASNPGLPSEDRDRLSAFATGAEEDEKDLHRSFFSKWGIEGAEDSKAMPNTLLYTSYMLRVCATRPHAEGLAVLLPCMWIYWHVGKEMLKLREELGNKTETRKAVAPYDAWIDLYASPQFEKEVKDYIAMVDRAAEEADEESLKRMEEHFIMACRLEHMFWDQAQDMMEWPELVAHAGTK